MLDNKNDKLKFNPAPRTHNEDFTISINIANEKNADVEVEIMEMLQHLSDNHIFNIISIPVQSARSFIMNNNEKRGNMNIGYIRSIDTENKTVDITIYSSSVNNFKARMNCSDVTMVPRVLCKGDKFITFLGFYIV